MKRTTRIVPYPSFARSAFRCVLPFLIFLAFFGCKSRAPAVLSPGQAPPAIELPGLDGERHSLSEFQGKVVLLNFWATWCEPCVTEMPALERLSSALRDKGLVVLAIGVDGDFEDFERKRDQLGVTFPIWIDESGDVKRRYGLTGVPESFVVGRDGKLSMVIDPDDGRPVVRVIGPRSWDSPALIAQFEEILRG